jgi:outer membrane protein assembly factor BamB
MHVPAYTASAALGLALLAAGAAATESPQFRGPNRDGVYPAEGLLQSWPGGGPRKLWTASGLGAGFAGVTVAGGRVYTTGIRDGQGYVYALDTAGKTLWTRGYGAVHSGGGYPGSRTTPTFHDGALYILSSAGRAVALDAAGGEVRWQRDLASDYGARQIQWGITESPLVVDGKVIFTPGGRKATMVALDAENGEAVWASEATGDASAYCSPRLLEAGTLRQIVTLTEKHLIGVDPDDGKVLWRHSHPGRYDIHAVSPLFQGRSIYVTDGYGQGGKMFELAADGRSVAVKWQDENLDVHHGGAVWVGGHIYGAAGRGTWYALDAATGAARAEIPRAGKGSVVYADGRLYGYTEKGEVLLVDPEPASFRVVGTIEITEGDGHHWAHPVIAGGVLYVRHGDALVAFDVTAGE